MKTAFKSIGGPRTLTLVHLRKTAAHNLKSCARLWQLNHPAFAGGRPFAQRLSLVEEGGSLPEGVKLGPGDNKIFSRTGALDDATPMAAAYFMPAAEQGFAQPGSQQFILGGGNLDHCLLNTFKSLVRIKLQQNEPLQAVIPLAMVYFSRRVNNPIEYVLGPNRYSSFLEKEHTDGRVQNYRIVHDGQVAKQGAGSGPLIELHWFSVLKGMFASPLFPEISSAAALEQVMDNFNLLTAALH